MAILGGGTFGGSGISGGIASGTITGIGGSVNPLWPITITVWGNSSTVVGINSYWTPPYVNIGDSIQIEGVPYNYDIVGIISTTCMKISPAYKRSYYNGTNFTIGNDYTLTKQYNEINEGDRDWPTHFKEATKKIDNNLYTTSRVSYREFLHYQPEISYNNAKGMIMTTQTSDHFTFGKLAKWAQWESDGGTVTNVGSVVPVTAITETATELAVCMCIEEQPIAPNSYGNFLFSGVVRSPYWNFANIGKTIYVSQDSGLITQTMPAAGYYRQSIGIALSSDTMYFKPDLCLNTNTVKGFS